MGVLADLHRFVKDGVPVAPRIAGWHPKGLATSHKANLGDLEIADHSVDHLRFWNLVSIQGHHERGTGDPHPVI